MAETLNSGDISTRVRRIAEMARMRRGEALRSIHHAIDLEWLKEAHRRTRKDGAAGVDAQTAAEYGQYLEKNLQSLLDRFKTGAYHAPPVRRTYIPKDGGKRRPLGIPTFEDKVLQTAVKMLMEAVYEEDFLDCPDAGILHVRICGSPGRVISRGHPTPPSPAAQDAPRPPR